MTTYMFKFAPVDNAFETVGTQLDSIMQPRVKL